MGGTVSDTKKPKRSCNRHNDCDEADREWLARHPNEKWIPANFIVTMTNVQTVFGANNHWKSDLPWQHEGERT